VHLVGFTIEMKIIGLYQYYIVMFWPGYSIDLMVLIHVERGILPSLQGIYES
jgi:hypothetical protein